jgi:chromosome segregation ATPase
MSDKLKSTMQEWLHAGVMAVERAVDALREELDASEARVAELEDSLSNMKGDVSFWAKRAARAEARVAELGDSLKWAAEIDRLWREVLRLRVAMAKAAQRADDWADSKTSMEDALADCASILFDALDYRHRQFRDEVFRRAEAPACEDGGDHA